MNYLPYRMSKLNADMRDRALTELGETDELKKCGLAALRAHAKGQKNLLCPDDEIFFLAFLRKGKYDMKKVFKLFQAYFKEKKNYPEIFTTPNLPGVLKCLEMGMASILPYRDKDGSSVIVFRAEKWNVEEFKFSELIHFMATAILATIEYEASQVCGVKVVLSTKGLTLGHITHIQLRYLTLLGRGVRSCLPVRLKGVHITDENVHVRFLWNFVSFYLGSKMRNRIHFHGTNYESIQEFLDPAVIPKDFGGKFKDDPSYSLSEVECLKDTYVKRLVHSGYV